MSASLPRDVSADQRDHVETYVYLCIQCPIGCRLEVDAVDGDVLAVRGASCKHGERYARQEHVDPRRAVSTTVALTGANVVRLPVRTAEAVPKAKVLDVVRALRSTQVSAPVRRGQVVIDNVAELGIAVVATRTIPAASGLVRTGSGPSALPGDPQRSDDEDVSE
jgi:CxxC motif-containing protein